MTGFPEEVKFKHNWRKYQKRVLDELQNHLKDGHLHVIAPPGSGKTILGLEVAIRLNKPTLVLTPTLAIRNQWIQRFCDLFIQTDSVPDWISNDIKHPKFLTVATYQGLHAACNNFKEMQIEFEEEETSEITNNKSFNPNLDAIAEGLKKQGVKTIVVDEAHHLQNEWWETLTMIKGKLDPVIVGLTATPPYDVTVTEWQRYLELNGPVDTEISVPELVIEGDLCPHQDFVHFSWPSADENEKITEFRQNIQNLFEEIRNDKTIVAAIENHPIWKNPFEQLEWIYSNISYYSACLIFLHYNNKSIPAYHLEVIGDRKLKLPELDYKWVETILDFYIYGENEHFKLYDDHRKNLEGKLKRAGAIEKRTINFTQNKRLSGYLTSSISKLRGISEIVDYEFKQLGNDLRMVILSDFIRLEFFSNKQENKIELNKIGVIPIFEKLRRENVNNKKIGVLTGSIIIIPKMAFELFESIALKLGLSQINSSAVPYDNNYLVIYQSDQIKNELVNIITQIFQCGEIEILVGTKSLLGEGWDAPAINALIMGSFVGSFVLSNQMRGRAIRTQKGNPEKTGNIWHLVTIDPTLPSGGDDFELLKRRFRSFIGISMKEKSGIENGIKRLNLPFSLNHRDHIIKLNAEMFKVAGERSALKQKWKTSLETGIKLVEEIKIPFPENNDYNTVKKLYFNKTIARLSATLVSGLAGFGFGFLNSLGRSAKNIKSIQDFYIFLAITGFIGVLFFGRLTLKTISLYLKYRDISKDIHQIGEALLSCLINSGLIQTRLSELKVKTSIDNTGGVFCHLEGGTTFEKSNFINALKEIIAPIENPRYIIVRRNLFLFFMDQKDYHSVPEIIGRKKDLAEYFKNQWEQFVGNCELVFTRSVEGRKLLLKSRIKSLASQLEDKVEQLNVWR